jgi:hypothetical protein
MLPIFMDHLQEQQMSQAIKILPTVVLFLDIQVVMGHNRSAKTFEPYENGGG